MGTNVIRPYDEQTAKQSNIDPILFPESSGNLKGMWEYSMTRFITAYHNLQLSNGSFLELDSEVYESCQ